MARTEWLSEGAEKLPFEPLGDDGFHCDVAIVGSGYGGAVAAARLAGQREPGGDQSRVWVLERGHEFVPGAFPERFADLVGQARVSWGEEPRTSGRPEGLFDLRFGSDVSALMGNGLGGGSLINAGVLARPLDCVFRPPWPRWFSGALLDPYFARAEQMLGAAPLPGPAPRKLEAIEALGRRIEGRHVERRASIAVSFASGTNAAGVEQRACIACGDCFTGCNHGSKNTLASNYLPLARRRGARLFAGATVLSLVGCDEDGWELELCFTDRQIAKRFDARAPKLRAKRVVLAAGAYGSTGILLRSLKRGFVQVSAAQLGRRFSTNGDMIAASYGMPVDVHASSRESTPPGDRHIGPTITGMIDLRRGRVPLVIEELAIPAALRRPFEEIVTTFGMLHRLARRDDSHHGAATLGADAAGIDPHAISRTAVYATMGDDGANGALVLVERTEPVDEHMRLDDDVRVSWPGVADQEVFGEAIRVLEEAHAGSGATVIPNPMWRALPGTIGGILDDGPVGGSVFTVHPLGGCAMAEDGSAGVVNCLGLVFRDGVGSAVHETLAVLDGAIVPTALEINPCLTIAALAEYAVERIGLRWGLTDPGAPMQRLAAMPQVPRPAWQPSAPTGIRLAERLAGVIELGLATPWGAFLRKFNARLDIEYRTVDDLEAFLSATDKVLPVARARLHLQSPMPSGASGVEAVHWEGTVELDGELRLFEREDSTPRTRIRRAGWAWLRNRGAREIWAGALAWLRNLVRGNAGRVRLSQLWRDWLAIASNAGESRRLAYRFTVRRDVTFGPMGAPGARLFAAGDTLIGEKRIAYIAPSLYHPGSWPSPWDQLTRLPLELRRGGGVAPAYPGTLGVDLPYFVQQYATQLQLVHQENQPRAIADLLSLLAYLVRLIGKIHIWSFRAPDYPRRYPEYEFPDRFNETARRQGREAAAAAGVELEDRLSHRFPGAVEGLDRVTFDLSPWRQGERHASGEVRQQELAPQIRLTRYEPTWVREGAQRPPVLLIHGFGASGNTFTLPTVTKSLVKHLVQRGFDPWVLDLRTSIALACSKRDWSFDAAAFGDIPAAVDLVRRHTGARQIDVIAHCIGAAMFSMAALEGMLKVPGTRQDVVRKAVLSQAGPLMELPPANRFRGYLASYFKHYLDVEEFDTTASLTRFNRFIDRILAAYPYPRHEWKNHLPLLPWTRLTHEAWCLRSYGIYGRLFEHANLNARTLDRLGDYLGHIRYRTYQQTIFYATMRRLTDSYGKNVFVTHDNIQRRFRFPVCLLHGSENAVFDARTSRRSFDLLASNFWWRELAAVWAGNREKRSDYSRYAGGKRLRILEIPGYGHQDCMIGRRAYKDVYPRITDFLEAPVDAAEKPTNHGQRVFVVRPPRLGPVLGWLRHKRAGRLSARMLLVPDDSRSRALYAMTVLMQNGAHVPFSARFHRLRQQPGPPVQAIDVELPNGVDTQVVVVTVHIEQYESDPLRDSGASASEATREDFDRALAAHQLPASGRAAARWTGQQIEPLVGDVLDACSDLGPRREPLPTEREVRDGRYATPISAAVLSGSVLAAAQPGAGQGSVCFALASCRYASTVTDRELADSQFGRLRDRVVAPPAGRNVPQFLFLAGDAIYADATYGMFDPTLGVERYDQRYDEAWTAPNAREVMRRLPVYPMLDDHEVEENFEGRPAANPAKAGLKAFEAFQLLLTPRGRAGPSKHYWYRMVAGGVPFFVADTRTGRTRERGSQSTVASLGSTQLSSLKRWLWKTERKQPGGPKFVVSPSVLAPWLRETRGHPAHALRSDAWDAFPDSLHELLDFIAGRGIRNVVFLSGDYHCSLFCTLELSANGAAPVRAYSIVSSGLYSPYPFANTRAHELELSFRGTHRQWLGGGRPHCCDRYGKLEIRYEAEVHTAGASFAIVGIERRAGGTWMSVEFDQGRAPLEVQLS